MCLFFLPDPLAKDISFQILLVAVLSTAKTGCSVSKCGSCLATRLALLWKLRLLQVAATKVNDATDILGSVQRHSSTLFLSNS